MTSTLALGAWPSRALGYPDSVIAMPVGQAKGFGVQETFAAVAFALNPEIRSAGARVASNVGVVPEIPYGASGSGFGGFELGIDVVSRNVAPPAAAVLPLVNGKVQVLTEHAWVPHVALGLMEWSPFRSSQSANLLYASATKNISISGTYVGRLSVGAGCSLNGDPHVFRGTFPFADTPFFGMIGYRSPSFGPFFVVAEHVGGVGGIGSTRAALHFVPLPETIWGVAVFRSNARSEPDGPEDGMGSYVVVRWDVGVPFGHHELTRGRRVPQGRKM